MTRGWGKPAVPGPFGRPPSVPQIFANGHRRFCLAGAAQRPHAGAMFLPLIPPAQIQEAPAPPPGVVLPSTLTWKAGSLELWPFDDESFEVPSTPEKGPLRVTVDGRVWRFSLVSAQGRVGYLTLARWLKASLNASGWVWQVEARGVARREKDGQDLWLKFSPAGSGELKMVVVERREPRTLDLPRPGKVAEPPPKPDADFAFLPPWPGAKIVRCADTPNPVAVELAEGKPTLVSVNFIEKEYELPAPVSAHEFLTVYNRALMNAGWEIEGRFRGNLVQIQAIYTHDGRDIRAILRLLQDAMAISVADVGAQRPK